MESKFSLVFLLVACITGLVSAKPQGDLIGCGENEVYTECGTACPPNCFTRNIPAICTQVCIEGCQCQSGYLLNNVGNCVLPEDC